MMHRRANYRPMVLAAVLLSLAACLAGCSSGADNPREARSGTWRGETSFGSFSFTVCEGGRRITDYMLQYTVGESPMLSQGGSGEVLIDKQNGFELSTPEAGIVFRGEFSADGKSATGVWGVTTSGETVSEAWSVERQ